MLFIASKTPREFPSGTAGWKSSLEVFSAKKAEQTGSVEQLRSRSGAYALRNCRGTKALMKSH